MATVAERPAREVDEVSFQPIRTRELEQLPLAAARLVGAAKSIDSAVTKLVVVAIAFCSLWGLEVLFRIQRIIERW